MIHTENYTIKIIITIVLTVSGYLCFLWLWFLPVWPIWVSFPISLLLLLSISPPALCRAPTRPDRHLCSAGPHRRDLKTEQHRYTLLLLPLGPGRYFILQKFILFSMCGWNWSKVTVEILTVTKKIVIINKYCYFELYIHQNLEKTIAVSTKILSSIPVFNIDNDKTFFLSSKFKWFLKIMWHWRLE